MVAYCGAFFLKVPFCQIPPHADIVNSRGNLAHAIAFTPCRATPVSHDYIGNIDDLTDTAHHPLPTTHTPMEK